MQTAELSLPPFAKDDLLNVMVETPAGSRIAYTWQPELQVFKVTRVLGSGLRFPHDFGFVPGTRSADGAPLDALVLADGPLEIGSLVECRVLGAFRVAISEKPGAEPVQADRLVVVPERSLRGRGWHDLTDLGDAWVRDLAGFLRSYIAHAGRSIEVLGTVGARDAVGLVARAKTAPSLPAVPTPLSYT